MGTVQHEVMHALGFQHEQNRPDRTDYVKVIYQNMERDARKIFNKIEEDNWLKQNTYDYRSVPYDYRSVMHNSGWYKGIDGMKIVMRHNFGRYKDRPAEERFEFSRKVFFCVFRRKNIYCRIYQ